MLADACPRSLELCAKLIYEARCLTEGPARRRSINQPFL